MTNRSHPLYDLRDPYALPDVDTARAAWSRALRANVAACAAFGAAPGADTLHAVAASTAAARQAWRDLRAARAAVVRQ